VNTTEILVQTVHADALEQAQAGGEVAASLIEDKAQEEELVKQGEVRSGARELVRVKVEHDILQEQCITRKKKWVVNDEIEELVVDKMVVNVTISDSEEWPSDEEDASSDENQEVPETACRYSYKPRPTGSTWQLLNESYRLNLRQVNVFSVGAAFEGGRYLTSFANTAEDIDKRLHQRMPSLEPIQIFMNCSPFDVLHLSKHVGTHNDVVAQFIEDRMFVPWLKELRSAMTAYENSFAMQYKYSIMC